MSKAQNRRRQYVYLRALEMDDLSKIYKWHNDPELYETLAGSHGHVSRSSVEQWLRAKTTFSKDEIAWAICLRHGNEHVGNIYLKDINWIARHGHLAIFIGDKAHQSKGYGQAAIQLMIRHALASLGLLRVYLMVLSDNERAVQAYKKCGFQVEGCLRRHAYKNGQFKDMLVMGLCADDEGFRGLHQRNCGKMARELSQYGKRGRVAQPPITQERYSVKGHSKNGQGHHHRRKPSVRSNEASDGRR